MRIHTKDGIVFQTTENLSQIKEAQKLRHDVYLSVGYIEKPYPEGIIPDFQDKPTYIVALENEENILGTVRLAFGPPFEIFRFWTGNFFQDPEVESLIKAVNNKKSIEVGALAVGKINRGRRISWGIYKAVYLFSLIEKIEYWVVGVDLRFFKILKSIGFAMKEIGPADYYFGSMTVPVIMIVGEHLKSIYQKNPIYYDYLVG